MGDLYLDISTKTDEDCCYMSLYSAVTLFVFKFCQISQHLTPHVVTVRMLVMHLCLVDTVKNASN